MDDLSIMPNRFVMTSRIVQVNVSEGPVGAWPSKLNIYVSRKETYRWIGIGLPRKSVRDPKYDHKIIEVPVPYPGVELLYSGESCRRLIVEYLMPNLKNADEYNCFTKGDWDKVIPDNLEWIIRERCNDIPIDCACRCDVSIELTIQFVYCEAIALLQGCLKAKSACSICLDEFVPGGDVLYLPECTISFI